LTIGITLFLEGYDVFGIELFMGIIKINANIGGHAVKAIFDSGAMYSSVPIKCRTDLKPRNEQIHDFLPGMGAFTADLYNADIQLGETTIKNAVIALASVYDTAAEQAGSDGLIGTDSLKRRCVYLSYSKKKMGINKLG
jgi:hypothetical protein